MNLENRVIYNNERCEDGSYKYWTFDEVIDIINRNDPDELFRNQFIVNFRDGEPIDGHLWADRSIVSLIEYVINNYAHNLGLRDYYLSMTTKIRRKGLYTHRAYELTYRTLSMEVHALESIPSTTYNDLNKLVISKLPQDGSVNIFEFIRSIPISNLLKLRTDLTKYDYGMLVRLVKHKDFEEMIDYINLIDEMTRAGNDLDIVIESIKEVENEFS